MHRMGLTGRIWLCIGVFVTGFLVSTAVAQIQGLQNEARLVVTSEALFPAAQRTQQAEASFDRMARAFADAVLLEDTAALDRAQAEADEAATLLDSAAKTAGLDEQHAARLSRLGELAKAVRTLSTEGRSAYGAMIGSGGNMTPAMQDNSRRLAQTTEALKKDLSATREQLAAGLRDELATAVQSSARQRWLGIAVFVVSFATTTIVVVVTIRRTVVGLLRDVAATLNEGARQILSAANQVSTSAQSLSVGASDQAGSLQETSASIEQMASMTRQSAGNAQNAASLVSDVHDIVESSNRALGDMVTSMDGIQESSNKVARIIKTIDEIAFQTNILALNAAVEAARAGDAGMGFAVVADEVRSLAQRSAQAAKDTAALIEASIGSAQQGREKVQQVVSSVSSITTSVDKVKALVDEVSAATRQQAQGIEQVAQAIARIEKVTQSTAATAEESAAASQELNAQAETAMSEIVRLESLISGARAVSHAPTGTSQTAGKRQRPAPVPAIPLNNDTDQMPFTGTYGRF